MSDIRFIAAPLGLGAQLRETAYGPQAILTLLEQSATLVQIASVEHAPPVGKKSLPQIVQHCNSLAHLVYLTISEGMFPIVLGGDHSIAAGTWSGVVQGLNARESFGLIWVDAHMDSHTYETSPSKAYHGMPLAALMGYGDKQFTEIAGFKPKLNPAHVVLVGIRSYEPEEKALLDRLGVRVFYMKDVDDQGIESVMRQAIAIASSASHGFGISLDLDAFDPKFAPGVGSPEQHGIEPMQFIEALHLLDGLQFKAFEIVELNPERDIADKTTVLATRIIKEIQKRVQ